MWTIPAERMKGEKEHQVPLSKRAMAILENLPREAVDMCFLAQKPSRRCPIWPCSNCCGAWISNGYTVHGFRSTFRDWAGDRTHYAREVIEHALAHQIKDKAEAAYRRSDALEKRRRLMEEWARYCRSSGASEVVALHG